MDAKYLFKVKIAKCTMGKAKHLCALETLILDFLSIGGEVYRMKIKKKKP